MTGDKVERLKQTALSEQEVKVTARRVEGQTFREIADDLDISPRNASKAFKRAKKKAADAQQSVEVFEDVGLL